MEPSDNSPKKNNSHSTSSEFVADIEKVIETLTLRAMAAGNDEDFETAFTHMETALLLAQTLKKKCLEAVLLNNLGLVYTMKGDWARGMLSFDRAMTIAINSCPSNDRFLDTIKRNISCLFDPKIVNPGNPDDT